MNRARPAPGISFSDFLWLDTPIGLGIVRSDHLVAVAGLTALAIDPAKALRIKQIQDVSGVKGRERFRSGLDSYDWRATLVNGAEQIAMMVGAESICISTKIETGSATVDHQDHVAGLLTKLAARLGYRAPTDESGDWYKRLT